MAKINKRDFVEVEYTGRIKDDNIVFDTTDEKVAKYNEIFTENSSYGPAIVCAGEGDLIKGFDSALAGKEEEKSYTLEIQPEDGFGKKSTSLVQLVSTNKFRKQGMQPVPGLQINIDGMIGIIKTVSGGRTLIDFNHPLSGRVLIYEFKVNRIVTDDKEKLSGYLKVLLKSKDFSVAINDGNADVKVKNTLNAALKEMVSKKITDLIPSIKKVEFVIEQEQKK